MGGGAVGMTYMSVIPSAAQRSRGIYRSWFHAGQCQDPSTPLRSGRDDMGGGAVGMTYMSVIPSAVPPKTVSSPHQPCHPAPNSVIPTEAKRNGGIYRSWFHAGQCQDPSTSLRSGRDDMDGGFAPVGMTGMEVLRSSRDDMGGGSGRDDRGGGFASVGMTYLGGLRVG